MPDSAPDSATPSVPDGLREVSGPANRLTSLVRLATLRPPSPTPATAVPTIGVRQRSLLVEEMHLERYRGTVRTYAAMPLAYPATLTMPLHLDVLASGRVPVRPLGMVYLGFEVTTSGALSAARPWDVAAWVEGTRHTRSGLEFDTIAEITGEDADGGPARWRTRSVLLMRSRSAAGEDPSAAPAIPTTEETDGAEASFDVPEHIGRSFARLNGDVNPIHMHRLAAKPFGFPKAIAHGWWTLGRVLALLEADEPGADEATATISFRKPVLCPSTPTLRHGEADGKTAFSVVRGEDPQTVLVGGYVSRTT